MDTVSTTTHDDSSGANPSSIKSDDSSPQRESGSSSPPPNCAICLGHCKNKSFTDSCLHQFCFNCLLTWSKVKAECPLCKQAFRSIIHNVRSNHQYEEYLVVEGHAEETSSRIDIDRVATATHRFRYRTTLTLPRRESIAIQQLLRHYPFMADVFPPPAPRAPPARRRREPASFRRTVYRHNLWARPLPDFTGRFRDCSPEFYRYNNTQMHRLVPWMNRELHYLLNENTAHISYVMSRLIELLPQHHINSAEFRDAVARYFGDRTEHFLHELYCFASTPYDMAGYDRNVQYTTDTRISTMINEVISSSDSDSVDSDIVVVSSSAPHDPPAGPSRPPRAPRHPAPNYPHAFISPPEPSPAPAPSGVIPIETISQSDSDDDDSEVMVVGYIKPPAERTPEIVDLLGSDSDVIVHEPQPEPAPTTSAASSSTATAPPAPGAGTVKLTLKRHRSDTSTAASASDSSSPRAPPPAPLKRRRRRRRSDDYSSSSPPYLHSSTASEFSSSSDSSPARARRRRRLPPRLPSYFPGRPARPERRRRRRHSSSSPPPASPPPPPRPAPAPGPSGSSGGGSAPRRKPARERSRRRRDSRDTRRLRSVVNVMYNSHRNTDESNSSANYSSMSTAAPTTVAAASPGRPSPGHTPPSPGRPSPGQTLPSPCRPSPGQTPPSPGRPSPGHTPPLPRRTASSSSDSEDNLPLNLTLQKLNPAT